MKKSIKYFISLSCCLSAWLWALAPFSSNVLAEEVTSSNKCENALQGNIYNDKNQKIQNFIKNELLKEIEKLLPEIRQKIAESLKKSDCDISLVPNIGEMQKLSDGLVKIEIIINEPQQISIMPITVNI